MHGAIIAVATRPRVPSLDLVPPARGRSIARIKDGVPVAGTSVLHVAAATVQDGGSAWLCFPSVSSAETYADRMLPRLGIQLLPEEPPLPVIKGRAA